MTKHPNNHIYRTVVVIWLTLSIASVILSAVTWKQLSNRLASAREAVVLQSETDMLLKLLLDSETSARGFALTGDDSFLGPDMKARTQLLQHSERLVRLTRSDAALLEKVVQLRALAEVLLSYHGRLIELRKASGLQPAADLVATGEGKKTMDSIRPLVAEIRGTRATLISDEGAVARNQLLRASLTSLIAGIIGVGAGLIAFWLARVTMAHQARERELVEARLEAERSSREKTTFLANMSHEIRTPMNAILGFSELLEGDLTEPRHRQYLQSIRTSARSLLQLISDILDMSKVEAGVLKLRPEPTDPREICNFVQTVFAEPAARKNVKLECQVAEDLPQALLMDRIRLRQILVNLVGNAVKFTDAGNIYVRILWKKGKIGSHVTLLIEVQDTGVGIPQDKLEAIFKPFVQAGQHVDKEKSGTGLGLSIVKRLTEMMGGTVVVASVLGKGSAFSLRFPEVPISARLPVAENLEVAADTDFNELRAATLLVVDDNETNCQLIIGMFAGTHHIISACSSGQDALAQVRTLKPDLMLVDIRMPGISGRETMTELRKIPGFELTPIIAVTASSLLSEEAKLKERFSGYLRKPFTKRELFEELAHFLPRQEAAPPAGAEPPPPVESATSAGMTAEAATQLLNTVRNLQQNEWPGVRDSLAINESKAFAAKLERAGREGNCPPLLALGQAIDHAAANYAIVDLERHVQSFPAIVEQIEKSHGNT